MPEADTSRSSNAASITVFQLTGSDSVTRRWSFVLALLLLLDLSVDLFATVAATSQRRLAIVRRRAALSSRSL